MQLQQRCAFSAGMRRPDNDDVRCLPGCRSPLVPAAHDSGRLPQPVHLRGESGTGKRIFPTTAALLAEAIRCLPSMRRQGDGTIQLVSQQSGAQHQNDDVGQLHHFQEPVDADAELEHGQRCAADGCPLPLPDDQANRSVVFGQSDAVHSTGAVVQLHTTQQGLDLRGAVPDQYRRARGPLTLLHQRVDRSSGTLLHLQHQKPRHFISHRLCASRCFPTARQSLLPGITSATDHPFLSFRETNWHQSLCCLV